MAGKIEIRASGEKYRFVVLNRTGEKLLQSAAFDDKASAKRAASTLVRATSGAEIVDATKPAAVKPTAVKAATPKLAAGKAAAPKAAPPKAAAAKPAARKTAARTTGARRPAPKR
jgi:hypothetical protein